MREITIPIPGFYGGRAGSRHQTVGGGRLHYPKVRPNSSSAHWMDGREEFYDPKA